MILIMAVGWASLGDAVAQDEPGAPGTTSDGGPALSTLKGLVDSMTSVKEEEAEARRRVEALKAANAQPGEISAAETKVRRITADFESLKAKFEQVATGITDGSFAEIEREQFDLKREVDQLLEPIVSELKKTTERPREIERLRADVAYFEKQKRLVRSGLEKLNVLLGQTGDDSLREDLLKLQEGWETQESRIDSELRAARYQLDEALSNQESVVGGFGRIFREFFANRGKSILLALLGGIGFYVLWNVLTRFAERFVPDQDNVKRSVPYRVGRLFVYGAGVVVSILTFLGILYAQSDWILLGLALLFLLGVLWAAREGLLPFYQQLKLMLNLGSVREGERVIFDGIPWEVRKIRFYTDLVNPMLSGGLVRVTMSDLTDLNSRPKARREPFFPCKVGEWVRLSDETYGEVISQTPELVRLRTVAGSVISYQTVSFLGLAPDNHSGGFGLRIQVGVDYRHQAVSITEIPAKLEKRVRAGLEELVEPEQIEHLAVEFFGAGPSSLDYWVLVSFDGDLARRRLFLERAIRRLFVEACNENGWTIPFTQVTVHQAA